MTKIVLSIKYNDTIKLITFGDLSNYSFSEFENIILENFFDPKELLKISTTYELYLDAIALNESTYKSNIEKIASQLFVIEIKTGPFIGPIRAVDDAKSMKGGAKKTPSKKTPKKASKKVSKKAPKKASKKTSKKTPKKTSKKTPKKVSKKVTKKVTKKTKKQN
jgi:hypothetical protein